MSRSVYVISGKRHRLTCPPIQPCLALKVNPASSKLATSMMAKLQDTIEVADVTEQVNRLAEKIRSQHVSIVEPASRTGSMAEAISTVAEEQAPDSRSEEEDGKAGQAVAGAAGQFFAEPSACPTAASATGGWAAGADGNGGGPSSSGGGPPPPAAESSGASSSWRGFSMVGHKAKSAAGAHLEGGASASSLAGSLLGPELSYGALAAAADTLDDKLAVVEHKRRWAANAV